jgi:hypothetical protein
VPQTIRFTSTAPNPGYVGATYTPTAVATSGLAVVLNASTPGVCSISGGTISLVATGTCVVTADQAGDAAHLAATQQTQSITVVKNPQGITFGSTAPNQPLVGSTYTVAATATSGLTVSFTSLTPLTCRVSGAVASFIAAGGCTIAADQAGNGAYLAAARQTQSVTIITAAQAIQNLVATIGGMRLPGGVTTSLAAPLKNVNTGNVSAACGKVSDFVSGVESKLSGGELTSAQAGQLLQAASAIAASLGCG